MKTIITNKIDGYDIIVGFGSPQIEPVETRKKVTGLMEDQPETKACKNKAEELNKVWIAREDSLKSAKLAYKNKDIKNHSKFVYQIELRDEQIKTISEELVVLKQKMEVKRQQLWNENLVYFNTKPGEIVISEEKYLELGEKVILAKEKGNLIDVDGNEIIDNRKVKYIKEGKVVEITKLGEKIDGPLVKDVSPEEFQRMAYSYMSLEDIEAEKQAKINGLVSQAAIKRNELEITGDEQALETARTWYNTEVAKVETEYTEILTNREADVKARN